MRTNYLGHLRRAFAVPQNECMTPADARFPMAGKAHADITIPAGRGARHKARRIALANPSIAVKVMDKRGACHYHAQAFVTGTIDTICYYWQRRNAVQHFTTHAHPSAEDIARRERIRQVRAMLDDPSLACPVCKNLVCLPNWPAINRCKAEGASDGTAC